VGPCSVEAIGQPSLLVACKRRLMVKRGLLRSDGMTGGAAERYGLRKVP
jgi:hypothetical protein